MRWTRPILLLFTATSAFLILHFILTVFRPSLVITRSMNNYAPADTPDQVVKNKFDNIYKKRYWGKEGDGSGAGSTLHETQSAREIILDVIDEYSIRSMLDAPCGSFLWMSVVMRNVSAKLAERGERFRYHGVDVVESLIESVRDKYGKESDDWQFSVCDFSQQQLPQDYDLVFSRDALMHLSYEKILNSLKSYANVRGARYLLVGSFQTEYSKNVNIGVGNYFRIDLRKPPFNLTGYVRVYDEISRSPTPKSLILYDIPNYLSQIDFDSIKTQLGIIK